MGVVPVAPTKTPPIERGRWEPRLWSPVQGWAWHPTLLPTRPAHQPHPRRPPCRRGAPAGHTGSPARPPPAPSDGQGGQWASPVAAVGRVLRPSCPRPPARLCARVRPGLQDTTTASAPRAASWRAGPAPERKGIQVGPASGAKTAQPGRDGSASPLGWALSYSHRGQFQLIICFPDGIYLNLYITCNFF